MITIGRQTNSDILIEERGLSRTQCQIEWTGKTWTLKDGDYEKLSTNGT